MRYWWRAPLFSVLTPFSVRAVAQYCPCLALAIRLHASCAASNRKRKVSLSVCIIWNRQCIHVVVILCMHTASVRRSWGIFLQVFRRPQGKAQVVWKTARTSGMTTSQLTVHACAVIMKKCRLQVERKCPKCGNDEMTYTTQQTRSADEGQTVFYTCPKCK
jgi:DNA-directed RNA polymerase I subunit RPA12